jgi:Anp1
MANVRRFVCWGPTKPPMEMTPNENARWNAHLHTPVIFNHHTPIEVNSSTIQHVDLNPIKSTEDALKNKERVLILTPLRNGASHILQHFDLLSQLTYPHELIDLAFLVGDSTDDTLAVLAAELDRVQRRPDSVRFRSAMIIEKDVDTKLSSQAVEDRHGWAAQGPRRRLMAKARNYLLSSALRPEHSWVYWRDVDVVDSPSKIIEDLIGHNRDVLVPNIWFHRYRDENGRKKDIEGRCKSGGLKFGSIVLTDSADDYNSWAETDASRKATENLDRDFIIAEGTLQTTTVL